jgi:hypothetical protein
LTFTSCFFESPASGRLQATAGYRLAHRHRFHLVSADQTLLAAAHQLGCDTVVVPSPPEACPKVLQRSPPRTGLPVTKMENPTRTT